MNRKWFTGIGFGLFICVGALIYTTIPQARTSVEANKNLENLAGCATDKNPIFLANVITGAVKKYDKDVKAILKTKNTAEMAKHRTALLHVISFLLKESKHFSPIYKDVAHQPKFDKAIDSQIQKMYKEEYAAAKDPKTQGEITKDYRAIVKALETDGVQGLSKIVTPEKAKKKAGKKAKKASTTASKAANAVKNSGKKAADKAKAGIAAVKGFLSKKSTDETENSEEEDTEDSATGDDNPADDSDDEEVADDEGEEEDSSDDADDEGSIEEEDDSSDGSDEEEVADDESEEDAPADDSGEEEADDDEEEEDDSSDDAGDEDAGEEDEQYTEED